MKDSVSANSKAAASNTVSSHQTALRGPIWRDLMAPAPMAIRYDYWGEDEERRVFNPLTGTGMVCSK